MLDKNVITDVLTASLSTGGTFAEIFVENTVNNTIIMLNGKVEKILWGIEYGCGIRIFNNHSAVYTYTNDTSKDNLIRIATEAAKTINNKNIINPKTLIDMHHKNNHIIKTMPQTNHKNEIISLLKESSHNSFSYNPLITQTGGTYLNKVSDILIANSDGLHTTDRRVLTRVSVSSVASSNKEKQSSSSSVGGQKGIEIFDTINLKHMSKGSAKIAVKMLNANVCPSGKMPVIIEDGFGGVIFHEACGHSLEATSVAKGASIFTDKMEQKIASSCVTAIDDGTIPNAWGSLNIDDEGTKTQKNILIKDGILKSFLVDKLNGLKMGVKPTGSARRESYKFAPTSRMNNTYIDFGKNKKNDIISNTQNGLYAKKMGGGSVNPATGEFNFSVTEAYMVRNGKIAEPVRGATLIGKGHEVLMDIDMVSDKVRQEQGMCGSISGSVPTNVGQPMIRVKQMAVGGRS
jgi:TldD protein